MKLLGFLLLVTGWIIVLAAAALLSQGSPQAVFVLAGVAVEALGLVFVIRSHAVLRGEGE